MPHLLPRLLPRLLLLSLSLPGLLSCDRSPIKHDTGPDTSSLTDSPVELSITEGEAQLYGESSGDQLGQALCFLSDQDGDGIAEILTGATQADPGGEASGAFWLFHGPVEGRLSTREAALALPGLAAGDEAGRAIAELGDQDGDGWADLVVTANGESTLAERSGAAYLLLGPLGAASSLDSAQAVIRSQERGAWLADAAGLGDVNGDGLPDLLLGAQYSSHGGEKSGLVALWTGPLSGELILEEAPTRYPGPAEGDELGSTVAGVGDVNGDGSADLLMGARFSDLGGVDSGAAWLDLHPTPGDRACDTLDIAFSGEAAGDELGRGWGLAGAGDLDGDGYDEILLGASAERRRSGGAGVVYVVSGAAGGPSPLLGDAQALILGELEGDHLGFSVASAGDLDGDGLGEILVGAPNALVEGVAAGEALLFMGPLSGNLRIEDAELRIRGEAEGDLAGRGLAGGVDASGDGVPDLLVSALAADLGEENVGVVGFFSGQELLALLPGFYGRAGGD